MGVVGVARTGLRWALALLLLSGPAQDAAAQERVITMVADVYCPFNCEPGSARPGVLIELATRIFGDAGYRIEYRALNWARAVKDVRAGRYDALVGASGPDAPDFVYSKQPLMYQRNCFYTAASSTWQFNGYDSLKSQTLGVANGYRYSASLDEYIRNAPARGARVESAAGDSPMEINVRKLTHGHVDVMIEEVAALRFYLGEHPPEVPLREAGCLAANGVYIAFSPARAESHIYADVLSAGLQRLRAQGEYKKIMARYGMSDDLLQPLEP
jgi:polar amino acid transport system substrate-binding protein